ncbi:MAG TPA: cytochrome c oxidase assembly protein [Gemmatimonadaceae bacterium]|nr:cytochrome c oxidase assembly protein [Gemmatimonadaceae bacterium]
MVITPPGFQPMLLHVGASIGWTSFTVHWSTVAGLLCLAGLYEWRARTADMGHGTWDVGAPKSDRAHLPSPISHLRRSLFYAGLVVIFLSLNGWLHDLSDYYLFSAHMVQHLLLTMLVPPLLIAGTPGWMLRPLLHTPLVGRAARYLTRPGVCFVTFNVVLASWHLPPMYNTAMAHHSIHILQHLMFMAAAVMLWWPILSPLPELPRLSYPLQMLYLFLTSIPMSIVAVYITYGGTLLYPSYAAAPRIAGLTPLEDQLLGGLIMWIPGGLVLFAVISVIFFKWQARGAEDTAASAQVDWSPAAGG